MRVILLLLYVTVVTGIYDGHLTSDDRFRFCFDVTCMYFNNYYRLYEDIQL